jgi:cytochrome c oxidase subunit II
VIDFLSPALDLVREGTFWMPEAASVTTEFVDPVFYFIYWVTLAFFLVIVAVGVFFAWKYRKRGDDDRTSPIAGSHKLEIVWSVLPAILLFSFFWIGFVGFMELSVVPAGAKEIRVTGQKWYWNFDYPEEGLSVSTAPALRAEAEAAGEELGLVVPIGQPVKLIGNSVDVLHSMFIPAFRIKKDVMPNRYTVIWFEATKTGTFDFFCTEYCGTDHSRMTTKVIVKSQEDYDAWVTAQKKLNAQPAQGDKVFAKYGCTACHSVDGTKLVGPTLKGLVARGSEKLADGSTVTVDDNYLRESLMDPGAKVVEGFAPSMPAFAGRMEDQEVTAVIDYIKSLD